MSKRPIGVFDSGLGGISVLREIHRLLPAEQLLYVADSGFAPYGDRMPAFIQERSLAVSHFLQKQGAKAIVVACNTATAHAVDLLRQSLSIPIIAIEPAVKPAVRLTQSGVIAVIATQRTANSARLQRLITNYAGEVKVLVQACPGLVEYVERGEFDSPALQTLLRQYVEPLLAQQADVLVLGCTHYPFLIPAIQSITQQRLTILEPSTAVAQQLQRILQQHEQLALADQQGMVTFFSSKPSALHDGRVALLWQQPVVIQLLPV